MQPPHSLNGAELAAAVSEMLTRRVAARLFVIADADELAVVVDDPALSRFTHDTADRAEWFRRFARWAHRRGSDGSSSRLTWTTRLRDTEEVIGFIQATLDGDHATIAYLTGSHRQGAGLTTEVVTALVQMLRSHLRIAHISAHIAEDHLASQHVAASAGLRPTTRRTSDGEVVWSM